MQLRSEPRPTFAEPVKFAVTIQGTTELPREQDNRQHAFSDWRFF